ncbi:hypothetical protein Ahu01nite_097680 [Winogradskya humida]|uniref:DUF2530 domain-containing protein n=1 Tax=Winogradskya humida TaxID=113566 RepID=A0ABQ4A725_9ACTN|nr:hypothetical protein Ahu01nite_097680 [Actinoplanes humidus]
MYKPLIWIAVTAWGAVTAVLAGEMVQNNREHLFVYLVTVAATLTGLAALHRLESTVIAPVREAFMHGYQWAVQQYTQMSKAAEPGTDLAQILRPPVGAWTSTPKEPQPVAVGGEERAKSQHRARRPRPWEREN